MDISRLPSILDDHHKWHDRYQIRNFIVRKNGATWWGQYKQCVRELKRRWELLQEESIARVEHQLDIEETEREVEQADDGRRERLELLRLQVRAKSMDSALRDRVREFVEFYAIACAYKDHLGTPDAEEREMLAEHEWKSRTEGWELNLPAMPDIAGVPRITDATVSDILCLAQEAAGVTPDLLPSAVLTD